MSSGSSCGPPSMMLCYLVIFIQKLTNWSWLNWLLQSLSSFSKFWIFSLVKIGCSKTEFASWSDINLFCCKMIVFMALCEPETKTWTETIDNNMTTVGSINPSNIFCSCKLNLFKVIFLSNLYFHFIFLLYICIYAKFCHFFLNLSIVIYVKASNRLTM